MTTFEPFDLRNHTILMTIGGSRAYGMHTEDSDVDIKGVAVPPRRYILGCLARFQQVDNPDHMGVFLEDFNHEELAAIKKHKLEGTVYGIQKLLGLALEANPSIWDVLFCREDEVRLITPAGEKLRDNRHLFISANAKHRFCGYAFSQLERIKRHRRWMQGKCPEARPERKDFNLFEGIEAKQVAAALAAVSKVMDGWELDMSLMDPSDRIRTADGVKNFMAELSITADDKWKAAGRKLGYEENFLVILDKERKFKSEVEDWKKYWSWKKNRNPERAAMEAKFGFDGKHACHLVRLMRMADELLRTGDVNVWRDDREELLAIRRGDWTYDQLIEWAANMDADLSRRYKAKDYVVPYKPDREAVDNLCVELVESEL